MHMCMYEHKRTPLTVMHSKISFIYIFHVMALKRRKEVSENIMNLCTGYCIRQQTAVRQVIHM